MPLEPELHQPLSRFLPAELLEQLPEPKAMAAVVRRLSSLQQAVSSFLPQYVADNEQFHREDYGGLRLGTFMFADVSGFTALSEQLQRLDVGGGAETLTKIINDYFATMLEILAKSNGQLLKFAGDALLAFFPSTDGEEETPRAIRTGLRMQRAMREKFQPIKNADLDALFGTHNMQLTMSIGLSRGKLFECIVGNDEQRDHMIQGALPGEAMKAEAAGERDEVIIDAELCEAYKSQFETIPLKDGFFQVLDNQGEDLGDYEFSIPRRRRQSSVLMDFDEANLLGAVKRELERLQSVARFVSPEIANKLAFNEDNKVESENRPATVIFTHVTGFAEMVIRWGEQHLPLVTTIVDRYYSAMQRVVSMNGGSLIRTDPYNLGCKLLVTFGAPVAHPDDPERAVTTALEMNRQLALLNTRLNDELPEELRQTEPYITQHQGITHGNVFAGEAGWRARREYTVMGDDVNLAARLMNKGHVGQILISTPVWKRVHPHFETEAVTPFPVKGKTEPVQPYLVKAGTISALKRSITSDTPFVGRDLQVMSMTYALQQAKGPRRRQVLAQVGDAGMGKTRMAKQIAEEAERTGYIVAWANCQVRHRRSDEIWSSILYQLLQLDEAKSPLAQRRLMNVRLFELDLSDLETLCCDMLFEPTDDLGKYKRSAKTSPWEVPDLQATLAESFVRFLRAFTEEQPVMLVIDELHQIDPGALAILKTVMDEITKGRLVILINYEPMSKLDLNIRRSMNVADLDRSDTRLMASRILNTKHLGPHLDDRLWTLTAGRPLFIEAQIQAWQQKDLLESGGNGLELKASGGDILPDQVRQLIISRLDRLPPDNRALVQAAAVLNCDFTADIIGAITGTSDISRIELLLKDLTEMHVLNAQPDGSYCFHYGLGRMAMYESLNRLQRQKYHRAAAGYWGKHPQADTYTEVRAYHMLKSGSPLNAQELLTTAAQQAELNGNLARALQLVTSALELFPGDANLSAEQQRLKEAVSS